MGAPIAVSHVLSVDDWMSRSAAAIEAEADHLTQLDSAIGDGDHGVNMTRGMRAVLAALAAIKELGAAVVGDKTIVDALEPASAALRTAIREGRPLSRAVGAAAAAAEEGARATVPLQARKGRASYLGERSVGHQDPGATSTALIVRALGGALVTPG